MADEISIVQLKYEVNVNTVEEKIFFTTKLYRKKSNIFKMEVNKIKNYHQI